MIMETLWIITFGHKNSRSRSVWQKKILFSLFERRWFHMWRLFCHCLFLLLVLRKAVLHDCGISWVSSGTCSSATFHFAPLQKAKLQSIPVISKSKVPSEILRDVRSSTYQICRIEEKINRTTTFHKWVYKLTPEVRYILKILWKRGEIAPWEQFLLFSTIFCYLICHLFVTCC